MESRNIITGVVLGDLTRVSMRKGTSVVVCTGPGTSYTGTLVRKLVDPQGRWEVQSAGRMYTVNESTISFPPDFSHGSHANRTLGSFKTAGFGNIHEISICDILPGVMHKSGAKEFKLSQTVFHMKAVRDYYEARQRILLSRLTKPPAVWIGGDEVSRYLGSFFEEKTVVQEDGGEDYGLSEWVLRGHKNSRLYRLNMRHPSHVLYERMDTSWKDHSSDVDIWKG